MQSLGRLFEQWVRAARLNAFYRGARDLLAERLRGMTRKRVHIEEVGEPETPLEGSGWHDMVEAAGGVNVVDDVNILDQPSARGTVQGFDTDPGEALVRHPDVLIEFHSNQHIALDRADALNVLRRVAARPGFAELPAVKAGQVVGALRIAKWLYPERFADVEPDEAMRVWLGEFRGVPAPGGYWVSLGEASR